MLAGKFFWEFPISGWKYKKMLPHDYLRDRRSLKGPQKLTYLIHWRIIQSNERNCLKKEVYLLILHQHFLYQYKRYFIGICDTYSLSITDDPSLKGRVLNQHYLLIFQKKWKVDFSTLLTYFFYKYGDHSSASTVYIRIRRT